VGIIFLVSVVFSSDDNFFMQRALSLAQLAADQDEVPVGAVIVHQNKIIAEGFNQPISNSDATGHAEIIALRKAGEIIANYRLMDTTLYVSLEPCLMCAGAMVHARIKRLVFGAYDLKSGVIHSQLNALALPFLNHRIETQGGLMQVECGRMLSEFFRSKRG